MNPYLFILLTILLTVYGQLIIKWQVGLLSAMPETGAGRVQYLFTLIINPWIISCYASAFLVSLSWLEAVRRLELSHAYHFTRLSSLLVILFSVLFSRESITLP